MKKKDTRAIRSTVLASGYSLCNGRLRFGGENDSKKCLTRRWFVVAANERTKNQLRLGSCLRFSHHHFMFRNHYYSPTTCSRCAFVQAPLAFHCCCESDFKSGKRRICIRQKLFSCRWRPMSSADYFQCFDCNELREKHFSVGRFTARQANLLFALLTSIDALQG